MSDLPDSHPAPRADGAKSMLATPRKKGLLRRPLFLLFAPKGFLIVAATIAVGFGLCHLVGLREDVPYALGTANGGAWPRAAGAIYALLRLAFVILVPILVLAAALFAAASKRLARISSPQSF